MLLLAETRVPAGVVGLVPPSFFLSLPAIMLPLLTLLFSLSHFFFRRV